jgi:hypothetical protein
VPSLLEQSPPRPRRPVAAPPGASNWAEVASAYPLEQAEAVQAARTAGAKGGFPEDDWPSAFPGGRAPLWSPPVAEPPGSRLPTSLQPIGAPGASLADTAVPSWEEVAAKAETDVETAPPYYSRIAASAGELSTSWATEEAGPDYAAVLDHPIPASEEAEGYSEKAEPSAASYEADPAADYLVAPVAVSPAEIAQAEEEDMGWEGPPEIGPDGRGPWLDGPDAPWGEIPSKAGRRTFFALAGGLLGGVAIAALKLFVLN